MASMSSSAATAAAATSSVAGREEVAHALEVLVDPHGHELDLEAKLVEFGGEPVLALGTTSSPTVSRTGR